MDTVVTASMFPACHKAQSCSRWSASQSHHGPGVVGLPLYLIRCAGHDSLARGLPPRPKSIGTTAKRVWPPSTIGQTSALLVIAKLVFSLKVPLNVVMYQSCSPRFTTMAWAWPAVSTPIANATPRVGLANNAQRRLWSGLKVLPLALADGLEKREKISIGIWKTCELFLQNFGDEGKAMLIN